MDGKLLLNLDKQKFKNVKVVKVPGIEKYEINPGERICQMIINNIEHVNLVEVNTISYTERGEGGFGHTGK